MPIRKYKTVDKRNWDLMYNFGINVQDYEDLNTKQSGVCAICKRPSKGVDPRTGKVRRLAVDHCHKTGKIRGLLCARCNTSLGKFDDSIELLNNAVEYLKSTETSDGSCKLG